MLIEHLTPEYMQFGLESLAFLVVVIGELSSQRKESIRQRDDSKCQAPWDHSCEKDKLTIHHIIPTNGETDPNKIAKLDSQDNLITLCRAAHRWLSHRKNRWKTYSSVFRRRAEENGERATKRGWEFPK